jgi:hypothetical protein
LWAATGLAILAGRLLGRALAPAFTQKIAATAFAGLGVALLAGIL